MGVAMQPNDQISRRIKLHDLRVLTAVVEAGSMSKAATVLNTTQSTISRSIAELEQTIGVRLLDRQAQGVEPTHYGHALLKRGIAAFDEIKQGIEDIRYLNDPGSGELRIGSSPAMAEGIVLAVIEKLSRQYPRVVFHVVPGGTLALYEQLRQRQVELSFVSGFVPDEEDLNQNILFEEPLVVVVGIDNPWARRRKIKLAELVNEPWTWPAAGTAFDARVIEAFRASGLEPPRARVYAEALNMRIRLAASGAFLAVVPGYMRFSAAHPSIKVLPVKLPKTRRPSAIVTLKNRTLSPLAQRVIECAREIARPLAKRRPSNERNSQPA